MAQNVEIRGVVYADCPQVDIPITNSQDIAHFVDTSDATLVSGDELLDGVTAYSDGVKVTGNITTQTSSSITASGATVTVPAGYYASQETKTIDSGAVTAPATISGSSATLTTGTNALTLSKTISVTPNVTSAGYISTGTPGNSTVSLTTSVTTKAAATITPGTTDQTISSGTYLTGVQTIKGDANLLAANIVYGKTIFSVAGSAQVPIISQDSTTKILSIS